MDNRKLTEFVSGYGVAIATETKRLSEKYNKDFFGCDDLVEIMNVGKGNIYQLMRSKNFPTIEIGNRKVVSVLDFVIWQVSHCPEVNEIIKKGISNS